MARPFIFCNETTLMLGFIACLMSRTACNKLIEQTKAVKEMARLFNEKHRSPTLSA